MARKVSTPLSRAELASLAALRDLLGETRLELRDAIRGGKREAALTAVQRVAHLSEFGAPLTGLLGGPTSPEEKAFLEEFTAFRRPDKRGAGSLTAARKKARFRILTMEAGSSAPAPAASAPAATRRAARPSRSSRSNKGRR